MSYMIAAAGTGGHVFPGLSVGEALVDLGVPRRDVLFVGGDRLEATVYPEEGFPFLGLHIRGLQRSLALRNLTLPGVVLRAKSKIEKAIAERGATSVLGMGGYVTIPTALAARKSGVALFVAEQNAEAGLANRIASRWAERVFVSFPETGGLESGEWVGNPVRKPFWSFDRESLKPAALARYQLSPDRPVLGVFGGSLGAGAINAAVAGMVKSWHGAPMQVIHLTGGSHFDHLAGKPSSDRVEWKRVAFEDSMELFYAASDLVVARAGGAVAELSATATPSILVPGQFGSSGHQSSNARFLAGQGAAIMLAESDLGKLDEVVGEQLFDPDRLQKMADGAERVARPGAARTIAKAMMGVGQ